jgi:hypothetical protein
MTTPTANWTLLNDKFYKKSKIYSMSWDLKDLSKFDIATAANGGPVALVRNQKQAITVSTQPIKRTLNVYSTSGIHLFSSSLPESKTIGFGFTASENLLCVFENGDVRNYNIQGEYTQFLLGYESSEYGIIQTRL